MGEILLPWLTKRLGELKDFDPMNFGTYAADGSLIAKILHSYAIITQEQADFIEPSTKASIRLRNLHHLQTWLKYIGIQLDELMVNRIATEKGAEAVRLFYELYLCLENKQCKGREMPDAQRTRLKETIVPEIALLERKKSVSSLSFSFGNKQNFISGSKEKHQFLLENIKAARKKFAHFADKGDGSSELSTKHILRETAQHEIDEVKYLPCNNENDLKNLTYAELITLQAHAETLQIKHDVDLKETMNYISYLRMRSRKLRAHNSLKSEMQRIILIDLWNKLECKKQKEFNIMISEKLLKQSEYEKQNVTKLNVIQNEMKKSIESKHQNNTLQFQKRKVEVQPSSTEQEATFKERGDDQKFDNEQNLELHKKLYKERMQMKHDMKLNTCKDIVSELVDIAVLTAGYREEHNTNIIPDIIWEDWKSMWLQSIPIFDQAKKVLREIQIPYKEEIFVESPEDVEILNEVDFNLYFNLRGPWSQPLRETEENEEEAEKLTLLGHIIHRLLNVKHPQPTPPLPPELPPFTHAVAVVGLDNERAISILEELLNFQGIRILRLDNITKFFVDAFKEETGQIEIIENNCDDTNKVSKQEVNPKPSKKGGKNKGDKNKGDKNKGDKNKGDKNKGDKNKGDKNKGDKNKGGKNKGDKNKGGENKKTKLKSAKKKTESETDGVSEDNPIEPSYQDKSIQTPRNIPEDDILSLRATLGKKVFDAVSLGEQLDDESLMGMFVEYLKENNNMKGWVLLNYPLTYQQASNLEEKLLGTQLPFIAENFQTSESQQEYFKTVVEEKTKDYLNNLVESRILPNPIPKLKFDPPKSYLTKYLTVKEKKNAEENDDMVDISNEHMSPLEAFYKNQGVYYSFYHDILDFPTMKQLARIVIEDKETSSPSIELFGENLKDIEIKFTAVEKKVKPSSKKKSRSKETKSSGTQEEQLVTPKGKGRHKKSEGTFNAEDIDNKNENQGTEKRSSKKEKSSKKRKGGKKSKTETETEKSEISVTEDQGKELLEDKAQIIETDDVLDFPAESDEPESNETQNNLDVEKQLFSEPPKPGEEGWQFINLDVPESIAIYLATLWENTEDIYITDCKRISQENRSRQYVLKPYMNYMKYNVINIIDQPDNKQTLVAEFQKMYNELDGSSRNDIKMKHELHCKVSELQDKLWDICDERKNEAATERQRIINENRIIEEIISLINSYMCMVQVETDRCVNTVQIIQNYYTSMLKNLKHIKFIEKMKVPRLLLCMTDNVKRNSSDSIESAREKDSSSENITLGEEGIETIAHLFTTCNQHQPFFTPFHDIIFHIIQVINEYLTQLKNGSQEYARKEELLYSKETVKRKKMNTQNNIRTYVLEGDDLEEQQLQSMQDTKLQLFQEWLEAINNEINRTVFRVNVIHAKLITDLDSILQDVINEFSFLYNEISEKYNNEIECVKALCNLLCKAIDEERLIEQELVLEKERLYIRPDLLLYPLPPEPSSIPIEEKNIDEEFSICQLVRLMEKLKLLAPTGMIAERALVYMLEDIITYEPIGHTLPKIWYQMRPGDVSKIVEKMYGSGEYVDWKDFIIYGLNFKFPTIDEILDLREQFTAFDPELLEVVSHDIYNGIRFDYNNNYISDDPQLRLRANLGLELLFTLFQIAEDKVNYSALLLYICKDVDPKIGLAKAFALCKGKKVFTGYAEYLVHNILEEVLIKQMQESRKFAQSIGNDILSDIINSVIQRAQDIELTELSSTLSEVVEQQLSCDVNDEQMVKESEDQENTQEKTERHENLSVGSLNSSVSNINGDTYSISGKESQLSQRLRELEFSSIEYAFRTSFEFILIILSVCLPWDVQCSEFMDGQSLLQGLAQTFNDLRYHESTIYIHEFLEHPFTERLLSKVHKFQSFNIAEEINNIVINRNNT